MNTWIGAVAAVLAVVATPALAATITFDQLADTGTLAHAVGGPLVGSDIAFTTIASSGADPTPFNSGVTLVCNMCTLSFTTGAVITEGPILWTFASGGSFVLTGGIPALGIADGSTILSGSFTGLSVALATAGGMTFSGGGIDFKAPELALFYWGVVAPPPPNNQIFMYADTEITAVPTSTTPGGGFTANVTEGDLTNRLPEPGSALLLLLGLGSLAAYRRRKS
jgi:hypothetical protein